MSDILSAMNNENEGWLGWVETQKSVVQTWIERGPTEAIAELKSCLDGDLSVEVKREALAFRASLFDDLGDAKKAEEDFLAAHDLACLHDLEKYSIEISLAALLKRNKTIDKAEEWYLRALRTASSDPNVSGVGTLNQLMKLRGDSNLKGTERQLAETVIKQSWTLLGLPGEPDLGQPNVSIHRLLEAEKSPRI